MEKIKAKIYHTVYQTTNLITGEVYIGKHSTTDVNDYYLGSGALLKDAISEYGSNNFEKTILRNFDNEQDAYNYEAKIVNESFINKGNTYNQFTGGQGSKHGRIVTDKTRQKMSDNHSHYWKNKQRSDLTRQRMTAAKTGKSMYRNTPIEVYSKLNNLYIGTYPGIYEIVDNFDVTLGGILMVLNGTIDNHHNLTFKIGE